MNARICLQKNLREMMDCYIGLDMVRFLAWSIGKYYKANLDTIRKDYD